jgi:hypothetical protein
MGWTRLVLTLSDVEQPGLQTRLFVLPSGVSGRRFAAFQTLLKPI